MIPYVDSTEKKIACALSNNKILDLGIDLMFAAGGLVTAAGAYYYFNPTQKPPELAKYSSTDIAVTGVSTVILTSLYRTLLPTISNQCR